MNKLAAAALATLLVAACAKPHADERSREPPVTPARHPTVDPKSNAAAEELVRGFARLLNSGRANEAYMLLGPNAPKRESFDASFNQIHDLRVDVGNASDQGAAAGSIYVSVPLTVSGTENGKHVERSAKAVLRRVNDVPGSTDAQRHWHIERIDWDN